MLNGLEITCSITKHVSIAYHENAVPVIREVVVENASEEELSDVRARIESRPAVVHPLTLRIDRIPAGSNHHSELPDVWLDASLLANFTEASQIELTVIVEEAAGERARYIEKLRVLPPSHWGGGRSAPELLAAFVRPYDPAVDGVLRDAATKLGEAGREAGLTRPLSRRSGSAISAEALRRLDHSAVYRQQVVGRAGSR